MNFYANTPTPPYYAVIFTAKQSTSTEKYETSVSHLRELAELEEGFLGMESAGSGFEITVSCWRDEESIRVWKSNTEHQIAQKKGRERWYDSFFVRIAKVERDYGFNL